MFKDLQTRDRLDILKASKLAGLSYNAAVKGYNDSYQKFQEGGGVNQLNKPVYNPSETVNQHRFEDPYKRTANLNQSGRLAEQDYLKEQEVIRQNEAKTKNRVRAQNELNKSLGVQKHLYDENYEVKKDIEGKEYQKQLNERTKTALLEASLLALPIAGELISARYLKNAYKLNQSRNLNKVIHPVEYSKKLSKEFEPYLSRSTEKISKEEEVFNSFLSPETQHRKNFDRTTYYDKDGNVIQGNYEYNQFKRPINDVRLFRKNID